MDDFKFMGSWPAWVRWLAVLAIIAGTVLWFVYGWTWAWERFPRFPFWIPWSLWMGVFLWCCVAAAPRFKLAVALLLGVATFCFLSYAFDPLGPEHWRFPNSLWNFFIFLLMPNSWPYAVGLLITFVLVIFGALRRRVDASDFSKMLPWLMVGSSLFVALSVANYLIWVHKFTYLALKSPVQLTPESLNTVTLWFIGREIALTVAAIGGVWALYFSGMRKPLST